MTAMEATSTSTTRQPTAFEVALDKARCVNCGDLVYEDTEPDGSTTLRHVGLPLQAALAKDEPINGSVFCDYDNPGSTIAERQR